MTPKADGPLLAVSNLRTVFPVAGGEAAAVDGVSFVVGRGETLGLVGESGSGKSVTALSIMRLVSPPGRIAEGRIELEGRDLLQMEEREMQAIRGRRIGFVFQEPMVALDPVFTIGYQIAETIAVHRLARGASARSRAVELLQAVRIPDPERRAREYPHQLSGGLRQRAMIALALSADPALLIADEPTTALDVTVQAEILDLLRDMRRSFNLSLLLITHDLGVVAEMADRVAVMYGGRIVEEGPVPRVFATPAHPYTRGLLASIPTGAPGTRLHAIPGNVPALGQLPAGCAFAPRCVDRFAPCTERQPELVDIGPGHAARCLLHDPAARQLPGPATGPAGAPR
ncbi:MAG TPA: ABC transporter ATP-binding protein [Vicinamibacterales bacterium]|nr:ABC transporter ATP-binding protein [Vicinamibacterales bacterium]